MKRKVALELIQFTYPNMEIVILKVDFLKREIDFGLLFLTLKFLLKKRKYQIHMELCLKCTIRRC